MLKISNLSFDYGSQPILKNVNLTFGPGKMTAVIGPNATGKSTLLKCISGILRGQGDILMDGKNLSTLKLQDIAKQISYLSQEGCGKAVLSVFEVVLLGRVHSLSLKVSDVEVNYVLKILRQLGIEKLAARNICELSGGQKQLVFIAQALVREPSILLLDEPTNCLDLHRELEMLELIKKLTITRKLITVVTLHQLDMAARYADEIVVLFDGEVYAAGQPAAVLTTEMLRTVYQVNAAIHLASDGVPHVMAMSSIK
ncbi:ABC transporter ATP-binding protein [Sporomusa sp. KB1]|jgi:iron complex transport system ATP-binding protein|uniref:ABC transporter ATP-binding protein n=1 Tax=Sporomusa sp. KB1 TaxID=943346 RepID=UPI0011A55E2F|nr:ABC transporter ATP-binding protein [Sporomusa sp. KB1]TWH51654.1 iron complex transport system ATP-binding protein [Sporomusa sp. KB1]TWH52233.1 iron complex transport system ATP-binding protein [Sporomusa sp. KB1]